MPKTREVKYQEAQERHRMHTTRTPEEQLKLLDKRPGNARFERIKLAAEIAMRRNGGSDD